jgi:hypothetical protein
MQMETYFVLVLEYEENTESLFTDVGIGCTFDDRLFVLKEQKRIKTYKYTEVCEVVEEQYDNKIKKFFVVTLDYEKCFESFFSNVEIKCIFEEQFVHLKELGYINYYESVEVCELTDEQHDNFMKKFEKEDEND